MSKLLLGGNPGLLLCVVALIAGCATTDIKEMRRPNTSAEQTEQDRKACWRYAYDEYPTDVRNISAGRVHTSCTTYKSNTTCTSEPYEPRYSDVNAHDRYWAAVACMGQKGYK